MKLWVFCVLAVFSYSSEDSTTEEDFNPDIYELQDPPAPIEVIDDPAQLPEDILDAEEEWKPEPTPVQPSLYRVALEGALKLPLKLEIAYFDAYTKLRSNTVLYLLCFYGLALVLIRRCCCRKRLNVCVTQAALAYKVVDERPQSDVCALVSSELKKVKITPPRPGQAQLAQLHAELQTLVTAHHEFQKEILDSHAQIVQELTGEAPKPQKKEEPRIKPVESKKKPGFVPAIPANLSKAPVKKAGPVALQPREDARSPIAL